MSLGSLGLAFGAGVLSILSPCVLPLVPIVLSTAASEHKMAPLALAAGLALSFTSIGLFVATVGFAVGLDAGVFRTVSALLMVAVGIVLALPVLQEQLAVAAGPAGNWANDRLSGFSTTGISGQFGVGLLLGAVWSPCVGPTLGAAALLAAQGQQLAEVSLTMASFGLGAALPLLILGSLSRELIGRIRTRMLQAGRGFKSAMGMILVLVGVAIISGFDKQMETWLVEASPEWLTRLTTSF